MAETLNEKQTDKLRQRLRTRLDELRGAVREELLASGEGHHQQLADSVHDPADESLAELLAHLDLASVQRHVIELREVEDSLQRMDRGRYGHCVECGEPIPVKRLEAYPTANRCRDCQAHHESTHAGQRPSL